MYTSLLPPEHSGWTKDGETYGIDWEDTDVMSKVSSYVAICCLQALIGSLFISN